MVINYRTLRGHRMNIQLETVVIVNTKKELFNNSYLIELFCLLTLCGPVYYWPCVARFLLAIWLRPPTSVDSRQRPTTSAHFCRPPASDFFRTTISKIIIKSLLRNWFSIRRLQIVKNMGGVDITPNPQIPILKTWFAESDFSKFTSVF